MRDKNIKIQLRKRINEYLNEVWSREDARELELEKTIIDKLAPELKSQLLFEAYGEFLEELELFRLNFSIDFL